MNSFWINLFFYFAQKAIDSNLWDEVSKRVKEADGFKDMPGKEKSEWVFNQVEYVTGWVKNLTIEVVHAYLKVKGDV